MQRFTLPTALLISLASAIPTQAAVATVTLTANKSLSGLNFDETVTFTVALSNITDDYELLNIQIKVIPSGQFSEAYNFVPGPIVNSDPLYFTTPAVPSNPFSVIYEAFPDASANVVTDGVFFTFDLDIKSSGTIEIEVAKGAIDNDPNNPDTDFTLTFSDAPLTFTLAADPVPEPASIILFGAGIAGLGLVRTRRRRS